MQFKIIYDGPGRLRLRCGKNRFNKEEGYKIATELHKQHNVLSVETSPVNGGILINYQGQYRDDLLHCVSKLEPHRLPAGKIMRHQRSVETVREFHGSIVKLFLKQIMMRVITPAPLRFAFAILRAIPFFKSALQALEKGRLTVEVLDGAAILGSVSRKSYGSASNIMFLLQLSGILAEYTKKRTGEALDASIALHVDFVWKVENGEEKLVSITELAVGESIRVRSGNIIPVDGEILQGEAYIQESSMTGEPLAVFKDGGKTVFAGTVVEEGNIVVRVRRLLSDSHIAKIVELIENSEELKAGIQSHAEQMADAIVPYSFLLSAGTLILTGSLSKAISVLMVDYSCAIKLATPIAILTAMKEAADHSITVKGGKFLEEYAKVDMVVFDKTGTLTEASPQVKKVIPLNGYDEKEVLKIAACLEEHFPHSVARAIVKHAKDENILHPELHSEVEYIVAHGIVSSILGKRALVGSEHFILGDEAVPLSKGDKEYIDQHAAHYSRIYVAMDHQIIGVICIYDPLRQDAKDVVQGFKDLGIDKIAMLTGDTEQTATEVCRMLAIDKCHAQVLPEEKHAILSSFKKEGYKVLMVGDGINDSPALACADVSVALHSASDIAKETADITCLSDQLLDLLLLRELSTKMIRRIKNNYIFIVGFNTALLGLGMMGILTPQVSAFLHNASTITIAGMSRRAYLPQISNGNSEHLLS